jgi:DNA repair exonuclease SbcCD ATPase subunit
MMTNSDNTDEQSFSQWARKRFDLYQEVEQQAQSSIAHTLQLASEFSSRMEEEINQLLTRYHQERDELQSELESLQRQIQELRVTMSPERQEHIEELARQRQQEKTRIAQERQQAVESAEEQVEAARAEREQILHEAYAERDSVLAERDKSLAERDRVLIETRQLSGRLADLQQGLQGLLGSVHTAAGQVQQSLPTLVTTPAPQEPSASPPPASIVLVVEGIKDIIQANDLLDTLEEHPDIGQDGVHLEKLDQGTLELTIEQIDDETLESILRHQFSEMLEILETDRNTIWLRYRA